MTPIPLIQAPGSGPRARSHRAGLGSSVTPTWMSVPPTPVAQPHPPLERYEATSPRTYLPTSQPAGRLNSSWDLDRNGAGHYSYQHTRLSCLSLSGVCVGSPWMDTEGAVLLIGMKLGSEGPFLSRCVPSTYPRAGPVQPQHPNFLCICLNPASFRREFKASP